ncbi:MAG: TonB-dependent receptor [Bryobacterales bacterium]|nr:TonB-dependent receptor [Bryobacterales bacterium]
MRHQKVICVCALFFAASPFRLRAQSQLGTGAISGTIQDASGQAVQSATVTATNTGMGMTRTVSTTGAGDFNIPVLPTGQYTLTVEKTGFTKIEQKNLTVTVGSTVTLKLKLQVGTVTTQVDVSADSPLVDSTQTEEVSLINRLEIDNLPINGRRYDQFALLAPGVTRDGRFGLLSYRGISGIFNNFQIEGLDDNQALFSEARGRTRVASSISANAIEQFQVEKSNFLPEYGRSLGGGINTVVRSGSNAFHADGFYYFRNHGLSAADPLSKATGAVKPYEQRQQLGGSIGGNIIRDKLSIS